MESVVKPVVYRSIFLVGVSLVGVFVILCGLGMAFGSRAISVFGFFGALGTLAILRLILWKIKAKCKTSEGEVTHG